MYILIIIATINLLCIPVGIALVFANHLFDKWADGKSKNSIDLLNQK